MGRNSRKVRCQYDQHKLEAAVAAVRQKRMTYLMASSTFGVPKSTIENALKQKYGSTGIKTVLSTEEEGELVQWIIYTANRGFPVTRIQLADSVELFLKRENRETVFKNNRPGKDWIHRFIRRHVGDIATRMTENLSRSRAKLSELNIRNWFQEVNEYITGENVLHVVADPRRVFNIDESAFLLNPTRGKVLARKGQRNVYNVVNGNEKESVTISLGSNAAGDMCPPLMVLNYARVPAWTRTNALPHGWTF